jgi:putative spermidine/putrescine transport system ATP-binding protein
MAGLRIENLTRKFATPRARVVAIDRLTLEIADGELLVLLGPSGSGKTTLLRMIAGLENPDSGDILLAGRSILSEKTENRRIGMSFQYPALLPQLTVAENIELGMKLRKVPSQDRSARTRELAELLSISDLLNRSPETLSGGQQQRVSLARALALRPEILLLDEPLANLDPSSRIDLRTSMRAIQQKLRVTTIYVTHDQNEAAAVADRIAILDRGSLQQFGTAATLYRDPANLFVAQFFAPERPNILTGALTGNGFAANNSALVLPTNIFARGDALCAIRPRAVQFGGAFEGKVEAIQYTGWSTKLIINLTGVNLIAELPHKTELRAGDLFHFSINPADLLFFAPSGERLR